MQPLESHSFITLLTAPWFITVVGGFILLGAALAYGIHRTRRLSSRERAIRDETTREIYRKDDRGERV